MDEGNLAMHVAGDLYVDSSFRMIDAVICLASSCVFHYVRHQWQDRPDGLQTAHVLVQVRYAHLYGFISGI